VGSWTFYGKGQGLPGSTHDVSADEGGNVYVAGGDALYVKRRQDERFLRFDDANAGLTANCNDPAYLTAFAPPTPFGLCPVLSVAGAAPGRAVVGLGGFEYEQANWAVWAVESGGADVVEFRPEQGTLARARHVFVASPPHVICSLTGEEFAETCDPLDPWWVNGRRLVRAIHRIVVNHDRSSPMYGDVWMGGYHGTFAALLARAAERGWRDLSAGFGSQWADTRDVWEHLHPMIVTPEGQALYGEGRAISLHPHTGEPWGSNGLRTVRVAGYGADLSHNRWWMEPFVGTGGEPWLDLWPDREPSKPWGEDFDDVSSMSHCEDGTLWVGSYAHGLARVDAAGGVDHPALPPGRRGVSAVLCDPADGSLWVGLAQGGVARRASGGAWEVVEVPGAPAFAALPVLSIQLDRWSGPRALYLAFGARHPLTRAVSGGGVASYEGP
jgi:hypothetical protein